MSQSRTITVIGNCQAQFLEGVFLTGRKDFVIKRLPAVFKMTDENREEVLGVLETADHIFLQRVDANYGLEWVRPNWLRARFPGKVIVWPNLYFDGYFPDVYYIYMNPYGKLQGPLHDYHLRNLFASYKAGLSAEKAHEVMVAGNPDTDKDAFKTSLDNLIQREQDVDIKISDFLAENVWQRRAFYTPNHPYDFVMTEMAQRLAAAAGFEISRDVRWPYQLDGIYIPAYPSIVRAQSVAFEEHYVYKGASVESMSKTSIVIGGTKEYQPIQLVEEFFRLYDVAFGRPDEVK